MIVVNRTPELTECDREAIHHIAAVQPMGALIALNGDWYIAHRSTNCADILKHDSNPELGSEISNYFLPRAVDQLREAVSQISEPHQVERLFGVKLVEGESRFDIAVHLSGEKVIVEFEPHSDSDYREHLALIGPTLTQLDRITNVDELCDKAAILVRDMLGYDRTMVYRFHADGSGEVVAENKREDLEPFLGLRYPATDIPQQARELFRRNRFRVICDTSAARHAIEPASDLHGKPLDLSMSVLRAHSLMHMQYMQNMGVAASLSIAIVRHDRLWGLISCHHHEPRTPPYSLRTVAEMFSQMFSLVLDRALIAQAEQIRARGRELHDKLMVRLAAGTSLPQSLPMLDKLLDGVIAHDGSSVLIDGEYRSRGEAPSKEQFEALLPALNAAPASEIIATHALSAHIPGASAFADTAAGALILPISRAPRDYLILWRKPLTRTVTWAGDPKKAQPDENNRIDPRQSFAAWKETVSDQSEAWDEDELQIADSLRLSLLEVVLRMTDEVVQERRRAQEQQELLIAELNHRVRNILNLISSLVSQSELEAKSVDELSSIIGGRISSLASAHDQITRENWSPAPLSALFKTELEAYLHEKRDRFEFDGEEVLIKPEAYTVIALVVHELVTNSAKYGSLCDSRGRLAVDVSRNSTGDLTINWRERGGPPVKPPTRRGFGSTIIERSIPFELKGEAELRFKLSGLEADFVIPQRFIAVAEENTESAISDYRGTDGSDFESKPTAGLPKHVLLVEDSMIIALDTEEGLKKLGIERVSVASSVAGALEAIERHKPDFAILDFNLGTESSEPVADVLREAGVPFVLATGYAEMANELDRYGAKGLLRKPYGRDDIGEIFGITG